MNLSRRARGLLLGFLIGTSLLLAAGILGDWFPLLRGPAPETSEWYWPYLLRPAGRWLPAAAAALFFLAAGGWWLFLEKPRRSQTAAALCALAAASLLMQLTLIYADRASVAAELVDRTLSNQASGFLEPAAEIGDINELLRAYPQAMPEFVSEHARTHPPGMILVNWAAVQILSRTPALADATAAVVQPLRCTDLWLYSRPAAVSAALGVWAWIPLLFAAATIFPAYAVAKELLGAAGMRLGAILAAALPALLLFAPKSVQLYAPLALLMFWAFHSGLFQESGRRLLLAGFLVSLLTFFSLGNIALVLMLALYALLVYLLLMRGDRSGAFRPPSAALLGRQLLLFGAGAASLWLVYWIGWGVPPWEIAAAGLSQHYELVTNLRSYEWWIGWNLIDLLLYSGWPLALGFLGSLPLAFQLWRRETLGAVDILGIVLLFLILVLDLSGSARGEVGRIWLFFMPLLAYPAAHFWSKSLPGKRNALIILALQLLLILCLGWAWRPVRAVIVVASPASAPSGMPDVELDEVFAYEPLSLAGYSLSAAAVTAGESIELDLYWRADGAATRPYTVFNHLIDENGQLQAQQDNWPVSGTWPPTCWREGDLIRDSYVLTLPVDAPPGTYQLWSGLYDAQNSLRLALEDGREAINLGTIEVAPR